MYVCMLLAYFHAEDAAVAAARAGNVIEHLKDRSSNRKPLTLPAPSWFENNTFFSDDEGFNVSIMDGLMDLDDAHGTDHLSFCHGEEDLPQDDTESDSDDDLGLFNYLRHGGA